MTLAAPRAAGDDPATARIRTIDVHTHILPSSVPDFATKFGYGGFVQLIPAENRGAQMMIDGKFFRRVEANCLHPEERLRECDRHGVDVQVVSTVPVMFSYWAKPEHGLEVARFLNDDLATVVAHDPARFIALGTLPMQAPDLAIAELERCRRELRFAGIQIGTNVNGRNLDDPEIFAVLEAASDLGAAVFVHPWEMCGGDRMQKYWLRWLVGMPAETSLAICSLIFSGVLERLPDLRILFAHGGGAFPATIGRIEHGFRVRPDLCAVDNDVPPRDYLRRIYIDSLVHEPRMLDYVVDLLGADRIALGTDYPFPLGELEPGSLIRSSRYDQSVKARMLGGTAVEWLGLEPKGVA